MRCGFLSRIAESNRRKAELRKRAVVGGHQAPPVHVAELKAPPQTVVRNPKAGFGQPGSWEQQ
jgi:hypothetical protein